MKIIIVVSCIISITTFNLVDFDIFSNKLNESIIAPVFFISLTYLLLSLYLLIFNHTIQRKWLWWAPFVMLIPFAIILLMLPTYENGGGFISLGGTVVPIIGWGILFSIATVLYTLWQRWYVKAGV